mgnify:CR=1 FL=1
MFSHGGGGDEQAFVVVIKHLIDFDGNKLSRLSGWVCFSRCGMGTDFSCFFFCVSRLSVHSDGLFVLLDLTNIIKLESGEKKKS